MNLRFEPTWDSLRQYRCPAWFADAKFGVWAHWGPQCVPECGDWYARNIYLQGSGQYEHHCRVWGHPSRVGFKDVIEQWRAERWDPAALMDLYVAAGARYFVSMGVHHDNFDLWHSRHHRWNAVEHGPRQDVVGRWREVALAAGLRFGVSEHLERSLSWFSTNKGADTHGPLAGVPYDGNDPAFEALYHPPHHETDLAYPREPTAAWIKQWSDRITDLVDSYQPDLLYTDGAVPFGDVGRALLAHYYNANQAWHGGALEAVYCIKDLREYDAKNGRDHGDFVEGIAVQDVERGVIAGIHTEPWQTDTCLGGWFYDTRRRHKTADEVIPMLADIVAKNGNLLLNVPQRPDGTIDDADAWTMRRIGAWLATCGEAIYGTRPWTRFGEGETQYSAGLFGENEARRFGPTDFRFTQRDGVLYVIALGWPDESWLIRCLAGESIQSVAILGTDAPPAWRVDGDGLRVERPATPTGEIAWVIKVQRA